MGNHRASIVKEAFLLQARNIHLFIPVFLIAVAYTTLSTLGYSTLVRPLLSKAFRRAEILWWANPVRPDYVDLVVEACVRAVHLFVAGTAYLLIATFTTGPAILAVTASAAVTACSGERRSSLPSFHALVRKLLAGSVGDGLIKGPFGTALLSHGVVRGVAFLGPKFVLVLCIVFFGYTRPVFLSMQFLLFVLARLAAIYVELVCTLAVVVSAAEPASGIYGVLALRQAWWIVAEKTMPAVILVFVKGAVKAVVETVVSIRLPYMSPIHYYYRKVAIALLSWFVYITMCAALQLWFVSATTIYTTTSAGSANNRLEYSSSVIVL